MANIKKLPLFCRCVIQNFPFIEEDFDALTNYELICKVVEYLNKVIASQNEVIDVANNLQIAFEQLHNYVANYFDNLDVQEEINNKLDAMVEAGTLQEIITTYIQSNVAWTFDTVADMKLATNLVDGSYARTLGYRSINDGGAGLYKITDTATANEMDIIEVNNDLYAYLIYPAIVTPTMFGAYADGTHDDADYIQRAVNVGIVIDLENKTYATTKKIDINKSDVTFKNGTINSSSTDLCLKLSGDIENILIDNITSTSTATITADTRIGFISSDSSNSNFFRNLTISNCTVSGYNVGISVNADFAGSFANVIIKNNLVYNMTGIDPGSGYGIHVANGGTDYTNTKIENNEVYACGRHCIYVARGRGYIVRNNYVHNNTETNHGIYKPAVTIARSMDILVENNKIENCLNGLLYVNAELNPSGDYPLASYPCKNVVIRKNILSGSSNLGSLVIGYADSSIAQSDNIIVEENSFIETVPMMLYACENVKTVRNYFYHPTSYAITIWGGTNQTVTNFTHNLYFIENVFIHSDITKWPFRFNPIICGNDGYMLFQNNISNTNKYIVAAANVTNSMIQLVNQPFDNDFTFTAPTTFMDYTINGAAV